MCHFHAWEKSVRKKCINPIKPRPYSKRPIVCMQNIKSCFLLIWIIMEKRKSQVLLHYSAKIFCAKDVLITIITMSRPSWTLLRSRRLSSSAMKEGNYICQAFPPSNLDYQFKDETTCQPKNPNYFIPIPYFTRSSKWWSWRRGGWGWVGVVKFPLFFCLFECLCFKNEETLKTSSSSTFITALHLHSHHHAARPGTHSYVDWVWRWGQKNAKDFPWLKPLWASRQKR